MEQLDGLKERGDGMVEERLRREVETLRLEGEEVKTECARLRASLHKAAMRTRGPSPPPERGPDLTPTTTLSLTATPFTPKGPHTHTAPISPSGTHVTPDLNPVATAQLPQIPPFSGEEADNQEAFIEWHDQFAAVAMLAGWDDHYKLVHLTTRLRGRAHSFYRSCSPVQRSDYSALCEALKIRFTPVQLTVVQTQLFHERKQAQQESVDDFAEALRHLYSKAYAERFRGTAEAERMGETILANQFVAGLLPGLKAKVVGSDGTLDQILLKARFEEAKHRELKNLSRPSPTKPKPPEGTTGGSSAPLKSGTPKDWTQPSSRTRGDVKGGAKKRPLTCFSCGMEGHMKKDCPYPKPSKDPESRGRPFPY